jgi:hypothetical protein
MTIQRLVYNKALAGHPKKWLHGTNFGGLVGILESGYLGVDYFGKKSVFVTDDIHNALNFGAFVIELAGIDESNFDTDIHNPNDPYEHWGEIPIDRIYSVITIQEDERAMNDILVQMALEYGK